MEHTKDGVPLFNENNYAPWKGIMEVYILAQGYNGTLFKMDLHQPQMNKVRIIW